VPADGRTCADHWSAILAEVPTTLGCVYRLASFLDRASGRYRDAQSEKEFGGSETARTLAVMHSKAFHTWLQLTMDQKRVDFYHFVNSAEGAEANLAVDRPALIRSLAPEGVKPEELELFVLQMMTVLPQPVAPAQATKPVPAVAPVSAPPQQSAHASAPVVPLISEPAAQPEPSSVPLMALMSDPARQPEAATVPLVALMSEPGAQPGPSSVPLMAPMSEPAVQNPSVPLMALMSEPVPPLMQAQEPASPAQPVPLFRDVPAPSQDAETREMPLWRG